MSYKKLYKKNYFSISLVVTIVIIAVSFIFLIYINSQQRRDGDKILKAESESINRTIHDEFEYYYRMSSAMGRKIASHGAEDLRFILSLFEDSAKFHNSTKLMTWTSFSWVDPDYYQVVNSRFGIQKNPPSMQIRDYFKEKLVIKYPWTIQVSRPTIGIPSHVWALPVAIGITNNKGKFLGSITLGFGIPEFENKIQQKLSNSNVNFVVIDNDANIILQSSGNITKHDDDFYKRSDLLPKLTEKSGKIKDGIKAYDIYYSHYQKMDNYPYIILTGFNQSFLDKEFNSVILPRILELVVIIIFFLVILLPMQYTRKIHSKN